MNAGSYRIPDKFAQTTARKMMQDVTIAVDLNEAAVSRGLWGAFGWRRWLGIRLMVVASLVLGCKVNVTYGDESP